MTNRFGTTADMVIQDVEENGVLYALAIDGKGLYLTLHNRLNAPLADPNRYAGSRVGVTERLSALGLDPATLLSENQHKIQTSGGDGNKKVNPLKASKRAMGKK